VSQDRGAPPTRQEARLETCNLLVSFGWRAPGRAGREIRGRLRALGDPEPVTGPTLSRGVLAVRTRLDPRAVVRELRAVCRASPETFCHTTRWVPVDVWTAPELGAMRAAVCAGPHPPGRCGPATDAGCSHRKVFGTGTLVPLRPSPS
jgi:hypothetical protein